MDMNKIIAMLEQEDKIAPRKVRPSVAKESLARAKSGNLSDINSLLEEDIMIDEGLNYKKAVDAKQGPIKRSAKESLGSDVSRYQKWVDYDMEHYHKISDETLDKIKRAGLSVVKDQYGQYEVISKREPAKECDATPVGVENPIPSPVIKKKKATEGEADINYGVMFDARNFNLDDGTTFVFDEDVAYAPAGDTGNFTEEEANEFGLVEKEGLWVVPKGSIGKVIKAKGLNGWPEIKVNGVDSLDFAGNPFRIKLLEESSTEEVKCQMPDCGRQKKKAKEACASEEVLEPTLQDSVFPEELNFDEEAFAELYNLDPEKVSASYVTETENEPEHLEIRFTKDDSEVLLKVKDNGEVEEVVNAEIIDPPEFTATISQNDKGEFVLYVEAVETTSSVDDGPTKSEGDTDPIDDKGNSGSDEFIQEDGMKLDGEYQRRLGKKPIPQASKPVKESFSDKRKKRKLASKESINESIRDAKKKKQK